MPGDRRRSPPWWPIRVDAEVEPYGLRIIGSQAAEVLEPGSLVPWEAIAAPEQPRLRGENGEIRRAGRRTIILRVGGRGQPKAISRPAVAWFSNSDFNFRIAIRPGSRRRAAGSVLSLLALLLIPMGLPILTAGGFIPIGNDGGEIGRRADIAANGFLLACAIGIVLSVFLAIRELWAIQRAWWVYELDERCVRMRHGVHAAEAAWEELRGLQLRLTSLELLARDGRLLRVESSYPAKWAVEARLSKRLPLWSTLFVSLVAVAAVGPIGTVWFWRWLQLPKEAFGWSQYLFMQVFLLIPPAGLMAAHWWANRRATVPETPGSDPE
jgi:hypothetical protein